MSGQTVDGKPVVSGWFSLVNSEGIPLDILINLLLDNGYIPDFYDFLCECRKHGWNKKSTKIKLETAIQDTLYWSPEDKDTFRKTLKEILDIMGVW